MFFHDWDCLAAFDGIISEVDIAVAGFQIFVEEFLKLGEVNEALSSVVIILLVALLFLSHLLCLLLPS